MKTLTKEQQIETVDFYIKRGYGYKDEMCKKIAEDIVAIGFAQVTPKVENIKRYIEYFMMNTTEDRLGNIIFNASDWRE